MNEIFIKNSLAGSVTVLGGSDYVGEVPLSGPIRDFDEPKGCQLPVELFLGDLKKKHPKMNLYNDVEDMEERLKKVSSVLYKKALIKDGKRKGERKNYFEEMSSLTKSEDERKRREQNKNAVFEPRFNYFKKKFREYTEENISSKGFITLFSKEGKRLGCIHNPDPDGNNVENFSVIVSEPTHRPYSPTQNGSSFEDDLKKSYLEKTNVLKKVTHNDPFDFYVLDQLELGGNFVDSILIDSAVSDLCNENFASRLKKFGVESIQSGRFDFFGAIKKDFYTKYHFDEAYYDGVNVFVIGDRAYNPRDFGNYIWGAAVKRGCLQCPTGRLGAHYNNMKSSYSDNPDLIDERRKIKQILPELDDHRDQFAIKSGCKGPFGKDYKASNKLKCENQKRDYEFFNLSNGSKLLKYKNQEFLLSRVNISDTYDDRPNARRIEILNSKSSEANCLADFLDTSGKQSEPNYVSYSAGDLFVSFFEKCNQRYPEAYDEHIETAKKLNFDCEKISFDESIYDSITCKNRGGVYKFNDSPLTLYYDPTSPLKGREASNKLSELNLKGISNKKDIDFFNFKKNIQVPKGWQCLCNGEPMSFRIQDCRKKSSSTPPQKASRADDI